MAVVPKRKDRQKFANNDIASNIAGWLLAKHGNEVKLKKRQVNYVLSALEELTSEALRCGLDVEIFGIGKFQVATRAPKPDRPLSTIKEPNNTVIFTPSQKLLASVQFLEPELQTELLADAIDRSEKFKKLKEQYPDT